MDSIVHGVTKNQTQLSNFHFLSTLQTDGETKETMTDFTFLIKDRLIKAIVFSVVKYECENWTLKKSEH